MSLSGSHENFATAPDVRFLRCGVAAHAFPISALVQCAEMHALVIRPQWIEKILAGKKTWEIRGSRTAIRGIIGLIPSGSGS